MQSVARPRLIFRCSACRHPHLSIKDTHYTITDGPVTRIDYLCRDEALCAGRRGTVWFRVRRFFAWLIGFWS